MLTRAAGCVGHCHHGNKVLCSTASPLLESFSPSVRGVISPWTFCSDAALTDYQPTTHASQVQKYSDSFSQRGKNQSVAVKRLACPPRRVARSGHSWWRAWIWPKRTSSHSSFIRAEVNLKRKAGPGTKAGGCRHPEKSRGKSQLRRKRGEV